MRMRMPGTRPVAGVLAFLLVVVGCTAATPTPTPTKAPAATPVLAAPAATPKPAAPAATPAPAAPTAAVAPKAQQPLPKAQATVRLGLLGGTSDAGFLIALERGYFKDQGLDVQTEPFDTAAKMVAPLATGQLDVGGGSPSAALYNAVGREIALKVVADKGSVLEKDSYQGLMIRQDLYDSGKVKTYADLKGLKFALIGEGIIGHIELDSALKKGGLTLKDVETVSLAFPNMRAAFVGKSIDGALTQDPFITDMQANKIAQLFKSTNEFHPNHQVAAVLYAPSFIKDKPDAANRFMAAYLKGARDYNDAFVKKDKKAFDEIVAILVKTTTVKDASLYSKMVMPSLNPKGEVSIQSLKGDQDWYMDKGFQKERIDIDKMVDHSFVKYAVQQLGPYK